MFSLAAGKSRRKEPRPQGPGQPGPAHRRTPHPHLRHPRYPGPRRPRPERRSRMVGADTLPGYVLGYYASREARAILTDQH